MAADAYTGAWWIGQCGIKVQGDIWDRAGHCWPPFGTSSGLLPSPIPFTSLGMEKESPPGEIADPVWSSVHSRLIWASNLGLKCLYMQNSGIWHKKSLGISLAKFSWENPQIWEFHGKQHQSPLFHHHTLPIIPHFWGVWAPHSVVPTSI